jgi:hypothetical protein
MLSSDIQPAAVGGHGVVPEMGAAGGGTNAGTDPARATLCAAPQGEIARPATTDAFIAGLLGDWYPCPSDSCDGPTAPLRFTADGQWSKLGELPAGSDANGQWEVIDISSMNTAGLYQLNMSVTGGTIGRIPALSVDGVHLRLDIAPGACGGDYVRASSAAPPEIKRVAGHAVEATTPSALRMDAAAVVLCDSISTRTAAVDYSTVLRDLPGYWGLCGESPFWTSTEQGLELDRDGRWYRLYADADGVLWRAIEWGERGTWEVLESTGQLNLAIDGSGTAICEPPRISPDGTQLSVNNYGHIGNYVRLANPSHE